MAGKEQLIITVKKYPQLWDVTHHDHHDKKVIQKIWSAIVNEIGGTEEDLKSKWRNMRDYYRKEVRKLQKNQMNGGEPGSSNWPLFPLLSFLSDTIILQDSPIAVKPPLGSDPFLEIVQMAHEDNDSFIEIKKSLDRELKDQELRDEDSATNDTADTYVSRPSSSKKNSTTLKRPSDDYKNRILELEARKIAILEREITDDEDLMFFKSLLPDFKSLPRNSRVFLKLKYQEMLYNEISSLNSLQSNRF